MLTKTKTIRKKSKKFKSLKKKWSGDMVDRYLSVKFGVKHFKVSQKTMWSTDGRTDGRRTPTS